MEQKLSKRTTMFTCQIAGFTYYDGPLAWSDLTIGSKLTPVAEDNVHDYNAVAVYFEDNKLGYIPREHNEEISQILKMGWEEIFDIRISRMSREEVPERQIEMSVGICRNNKKINNNKK